MSLNEELLQQIAEARPANEAEVETKIVLHLLRLLGYTDADRADKVRVRMRFGRDVFEKVADYLLFNGPERSLPKALLAVENKRLGESLEIADEQARSYATWAGTPFIMACNGESILVAQFLPGAGVVSSVTVRVADLPKEFFRIQRMIGRSEAVLAKERISYITTYLPEVENLPPAEFFREYLLRLSERFRALRTDITPLMPPSQRESQLLQIPVHVRKLKDDGHDFGVGQFTDLLFAQSANLFVEGPPGSGKSTFCRRIVSELAERCLRTPSIAPIPIFLDLGRGIPASLAAAFHQACEDLGVRVFPELYKRSLTSAKALLLLDGLDELPGSPLTIPELARLIDDDSVSGTLVTARPGWPNKTTTKRHFVPYRIRPLSDVELESLLSTYLTDPDRAANLLGSVDKGRAPNLRSAMAALMAIRVLNENPHWEQLSTFELYTQYVGALHRYFNASTVRGASELERVGTDDVLHALATSAFLSMEAQASGYNLTLGELGTTLKSKHGEAATALLNCGLLTSHGDRAAFIHRSFQDFGLAYRIITDFRVRGCESLTHPHITDDAYRIASSSLMPSDEGSLIDAIGNKDKHVRKRVTNLLWYSAVSVSITTAMLNRLRIEPSIKIWSKIIRILTRSCPEDFRQYLQQSFAGFSRKQIKRIAAIVGGTSDQAIQEILLGAFDSRPLPELAQAIFRIAVNRQDLSQTPKLVQIYHKMSLRDRTSLAQLLATTAGTLKEALSMNLLEFERSFRPMVSLLASVNVESLNKEKQVVVDVTHVIGNMSDHENLSTKERRRLRRVVKRIQAIPDATPVLEDLGQLCSLKGKDPATKTVRTSLHRRENS